MQPLLMVIALCLFFASPVNAQVEQPVPDILFTKTSSSTNPDIKRTDMYDYQPSAMSESDGNIVVWDCGQEATGIGSDSIVYTQFNSQGARISDPTVVMKANRSITSAADSAHSCSPTVVRHAHQYVDLDGPTGNLTQAGDELYLMYYECAPVFYNKCDGSAASTNNGQVTCNPNLVNTAGFTQICVAASTDKVNWHKYNDTLFHAPEWVHYGPVGSPPTPVIKVGPEIAANCGFTEADLQATGKYRIYLQYDPCKDNPSGNYGVGQPSAWTKVFPDGTKQVWLWYVDTKGSWNNRTVYLAKSWDGFHFETPIATNQKVSSEIRYYPGEVAGHNGLFIAISTFGQNYFMHSSDGINWVQPHYEDAWWWALHVKNPPMTDAQAREYAFEEISDFLVGGARLGKTPPNNLCTSPGATGLLANQYGNLANLADITLFSNEGYMGSGDGCTATNGCVCYDSSEDTWRGRTWGIYLVKGQFNLNTPPTPTPSPNPLDYNNDGYLDFVDLRIFLLNNLLTPSIYTWNHLIHAFGR